MVNGYKDGGKVVVNVLSEYLRELERVEILDEEKEAELWRRYKEGEDVKSRERLIEAYQPFVFKIVKEFGFVDDLMMDMIQEGTIGLIEAVERFDHRRGIKFSTYAQHRIKGRILNLFQKQLKNDTISLDSLYADGDGLALIEQLADEKNTDISEVAERSYIQERVFSAMERLPEKERTVVRAVYLEDREPGSVAEALNISISYLYKLQKRAIRRMRGMLTKFISEFNALGT